MKRNQARRPDGLLSMVAVSGVFFAATLGHADAGPSPVFFDALVDGQTIGQVVLIDSHSVTAVDLETQRKFLASAIVVEITATQHVYDAVFRDGFSDPRLMPIKLGALRLGHPDMDWERQGYGVRAKPEVCKTLQKGRFTLRASKQTFSKEIGAYIKKRDAEFPDGAGDARFDWDWVEKTFPPCKKVLFDDIDLGAGRNVT